MWKLRTESDKFLHLDAIRIISSILVVIYHNRNQWNFGSTFGSDYPQFEVLRLSVDMFFVISGAIICYCYGEMRGSIEFCQFMWKRGARLLPLHWATLAFYVLVGLVYMRIDASPGDPSKYDWNCLIPNALLLNSFHLCPGHSFNHVSWSISAEMFCYAAFPASLMIIKWRRWAPAALAAAWIVGLFAMQSTLPEDWTNLTHDFGVIRSLPAFLLGMSAFALRYEIARFLVVPAAALVFGLGCLIIGAIFLLPIQLLIFLVYFIAISAIAADTKESGTFVRFLAPWGQLAYGVYMLHTVVRTIIFSICAKGYLGSSIAVQNLALVICFFASFGLAYVSFFAFERPARKWLCSLWSESERQAPKAVMN